MSASRVVQKRFSYLTTVAASSILLAVLFMFMMPAQAFAAISASSLVSLTNQDRAAQGLGTLTVNPLLVQAAQAKANDMAEKSYFAHQTPEGYSSWHWFKLVGYGYSRAGENLAQGYSTASEIETAWLNSPTHRANIMNGAFTEIGIATAAGTYQGRPVIFVAQMFGTPSKTAVAKPAPVAPKPAAAPTPLPVATTVTRNVAAVTQQQTATPKNVTVAQTAPKAAVRTQQPAARPPATSQKVVVAQPLEVPAETLVVPVAVPVNVVEAPVETSLKNTLALLEQLITILSYTKLAAISNPHG